MPPVTLVCESIFRRLVPCDSLTVLAHSLIPWILLGPQHQSRIHERVIITLCTSPVFVYSVPYLSCPSLYDRTLLHMLTRCLYLQEPDFSCPLLLAQQLCMYVLHCQAL